MLSSPGRRPPVAHLAVLIVAALIAASVVDLAAVHGPVAAAADDNPSPMLVRPEEGEVWRLYLAVLGRSPEPDGFGYWVAERVEGVPLRVVAGSFLSSREFDTRYGATTDRDFVELVYRNVLGRSGEPDGVDYWRSVLAGGYPRTEVVLLFAESEEHRAATGTALEPLPPYQPDVRDPTDDELGDTWRPGCPVDRDELRTVELDHVDLGGAHRRGRLVVHHDVAADVVDVFAQVYAARFPIAMMVPVAQFGGDDDASMAAGNTSAFNCRTVTGGVTWSRHAFGRAIDINPIHNPYVSGGIVLPPAGVDHLDRSRYHPAMIRSGDVVTDAFSAVGWRWGGEFTRVADFQHFER